MSEQANVGGEFEFEPEVFSGRNEFPFRLPGQFTSSGRSALTALLKFVAQQQGGIRVFIPDYICESVIRVVERCAQVLQPYPLTRVLEPDHSRLQDLFLKPDCLHSVVLVVNYFGLVDVQKAVAKVRAACPGATIVTDNVQSLFEPFQSTDAEFSFVSFRKFLPVPDGGCVFARDPAFSAWVQLEPPNWDFVGSKTLGSVLKKMGSRITSEEFLGFFHRGEQALDDDDVVREMSSFSRAVLDSLDMEQIVRRRSENAQFVVDFLSSRGVNVLFREIGERAPLAVPILIPNRDKVRAQLAARGIYYPVHWPVEKSRERMLEMGSFMAKNMMSVVIDQRYTLNQMEHALTALVDAM